MLVKHSAPEVRAAAPAAEWHLSAAGAARCVALAERLRPFDARAIASSVEPKAVETATLVAQELGVPVQLVPGLHEHDRRDTHLLGEAEFGAALARFDAAVTSLAAAVPDPDDVVVVSHGTVISLFVAAHAGIDGLALWRRLGLPSFVVLDRASLAVIRVEDAIA